jgi:limonene 1,2-monooxygenase
MRFGIFMAPFHRVGENPTTALDRDLELIEHLDRLNFDEAWIGEHHSAGWEIIASPELMIAAAAQRTRTIKLGTGVTSLAYHHPFIVADRMVQLDHMTRGRAMLGVGPGALSSDAYMMGIDPVTQRARMDEATGAILRLMRGEIVSMETEWFTLRDARLQLASYTYPHMPVAVASIFSPAGPTVCGKYGIGMLSVSAAQPGGIVSAAENWAIAEAEAARSGTTVSRADWRVVLSMHLAETREQAEDDVRERSTFFYQDYFGDTIGVPGAPIANFDSLKASGSLIVGTPDDAIEAVERIIELTGGIGTILFQAHEYATWQKTLQSFELWARYVAPHFQGQARAIEHDRDWVREHRGTIFSRGPAAIQKAFSDAGKELPDMLKERLQRGAQ